MSKYPKYILHIDDDPVIRELIRTMFSRSKKKLVLKSCHSARDAVKETATFKPDLILLDMNMPKQNGIETVALLRKSANTMQTPVIFITGKNDTPPPNKENNILGTLQKPFIPAQLLEEIGTLYSIKKSQPW